MTLYELQDKCSAVITQVDNERLYNMGIQPNRIVTVLRRMATCLHIRVGSTEWAIRDRDAELVKIAPQYGSVSESGLLN